MSVDYNNLDLLLAWVQYRVAQALAIHLARNKAIYIASRFFDGGLGIKPIIQVHSRISTLATSFWFKCVDFCTFFSPLWNKGNWAQAGPWRRCNYVTYRAIPHWKANSLALSLFDGYQKGKTRPLTFKGLLYGRTCQYEKGRTQLF